MKSYRHRIRFAHFVIILLSLFIKPLHGADVSITPSEFMIAGSNVLRIEGEIVKGDYLKVKQHFARLIKEAMRDEDYPLTFEINSAGGDIEEAMKIGRFARELLVRVVSGGNKIIDPKSEDAIWIKNYIASNPDRAFEFQRYKYIELGTPLREEDLKRCYSACILIFYGGVNRVAGVNIDKRKYSNMIEIPIIGIHRPYYDPKYFGQLSPANAHKEFNNLEVKVRRYLNEMGAPQSLTDRMYKVDSNAIELLNEREFDALYQRRAPFLSQWLGAKCGSFKREDFMSPQELNDWRAIKEARKIEAKREIKKSIKNKGYTDFVYVDAVIQKFIPKGFSKDRVKYLEELIKKHDLPRHHCRKMAIIFHQMDWENSYE